MEVPSVKIRSDLILAFVLLVTLSTVTLKFVFNPPQAAARLLALLVAIRSVRPDLTANVPEDTK